jgi:anti-sigma factor ChrR (cupin superfamily)
MITEHQQEQASLFALGALPEAEARAFGLQLAEHAELAALVRTLQDTADLFALSQPVVPPPVALRDKVLARIEALGAVQKSAVPPPMAALAGLNFVTEAASHDWKPLPVPGTYIKLLSLEKERGYAVLLGKLDAGARYPAHVNAGPEDFFILTGDLVVGERTLNAGDFHHAAAGSQHTENFSVGGCTLLAVLTTDDPLVAFAMA